MTPAASTPGCPIQKGSFDAGHPIFAGLATLDAGDTISVCEPSELPPTVDVVARCRDGCAAILATNATHTKGGRVIVDGGWTKLQHYWNDPHNRSDTRRYLLNITRWLCRVLVSTSRL